MLRLALALIALIAITFAEEKKPELPGAQVDGAVLLPNQWYLRPAGTQLKVGDNPVNIALHPGGKFAAVLHCGYGQHEVQVLDIGSAKILSRVNVAEAFYGCAFTKDGKRLVVSGSGDEVLHIFKFKGGYLGEPIEVRLRDRKKRGIPGGLAISADGAKIYVANVWGQTVSRVRLREDDGAAEITDLAIVAGDASEPAPAVGAKTDDPSITKRAQAVLDMAGKDAPFPFMCVLDEARERLYVSLWARKQVLVIDTKAWKEIARWEVEEHPNEMLLSRDGRHLFVANANRNSVSVVATDTGKVVETLVAELFQNAPPGNTPNSLALTPDEEFLFVANANINCVAVFEIEQIGKSRSLGFIPTGWYPTSVRHAGGRLLIANGKGILSKSNRHATQPGAKDAPGNVEEYIGGLMQGTVGVLDLPVGEKFAEQMKKWTALALTCMPPTERRIGAAQLEGNPVPRKVGDKSPITHVIYIVKENRTFDQVLGDLGRGNGDPSLCIFGEDVSPNHHALAREFVTLDNFYVESEVSADGHEWTMGAYATDFVEKHWPLSYGHNRHNKFPYPAEGNFAAATPAGGYLWDRAAAAGVTYRSYGEWTTSPKKDGTPGTAKARALEGHFDPLYYSFDMVYPDVKRAERFISELRRFEKEGAMPRLQIVRLPNDHTSGASPGKPTPTAHVADNDLAFGQIVEAVSRSKFWPTTAIFVVEDDAQNGPDHVDAHRTIAYAISPYIRRGTVDSTLYSTASMLRTIELILGMQPMSQFDALAMPMFASFQKDADLRPYTALVPKADMDAKTPKTAWGVPETLKMDFSKEDAADDLVLNEIIWRSVRGADSPMPAPVRRAWVLGEDE